MAYTPYGYNPYYPPPMQDNLMQMRQQFQPPAQPAPAPQQGMIWVQGETGAKSYMVASGNTVPLWDSENQTIYIKSVDASGIPSMRVLDYTERTVAPKSTAATPGVDYAPRSELEALTRQVADLKAQVAALSEKKDGGEEGVKRG
jgi:hypothetical protein|nr:MAG TPA: hypothetical protein [Caudoviricetes sp.]